MPRGGYHHRRGGPVFQTTFTLDKLFQDDSQHGSKPSAVRSAGTVGKWGITSFTTTNSFHNNNSAVPVKTDQTAKPKKFFKSRNVDTTPAPAPAAATSPLKSPSSNEDDEHKPPIVLRIFKGTSCIVAEGENYLGSPPHAPASSPSPVAEKEKPKSPGGGKRGRRRSSAHSVEVETPEPPRSPRPKRARREVLDPALQSIISQLVSEDEEEESAFEPIQPTASIEKNSEEEDIFLKNSEDKENLGNDDKNMMEVDREKAETATTVSPKHESNENSDSQPETSHQVTSSPSSGLKLIIKKTADTQAVEEETAPSESSLLDAPSTSQPELLTQAPPNQPVKKKSIFKSRAGKESAGNTKRHVYKHNYWPLGSAGDGGGGESKKGETEGKDLGEFADGALSRVAAEPRPNSPLDDISKIKCDKKDKGFYTVVRNVKKAHQIQESGEFQEFNDDVDYILDALKDNNPVGTRCLSAITLAGKCMTPAFRMHVRAHGTVDKFFKALHDATQDPSLGLCTATVMFVLSQDRLNMDLDRDSLELMLNLLESDASHRNALDDCGMTSTQLHKNKQKVKELCAEIQSKGLAKHLDLDNITVGQLAMETLLSLTSKRAGEWFKEELRELGGLEHIVQTITECSRSLETYISQWTDPLLDRLRKIDRCLRVLENVTSGNEENQVYLLKYQSGLLLSTIIKLYKICNDEIALYPCMDSADKVSTGYVLREALLATLKVLINLTQDYSKKLFSETLVNGRVSLVQSSLHLLLQVPNYIPDDDKFDFIVMVLTLLINLVEDNEDNRRLLMESAAPPDPESVSDTRESVSAVSALVRLFYAHEKSAYDEEAQTDAILDGKKEDGGEEGQTSAPAKSKGEEIEETIAKLLKKAGNHMEHTFICAYIALLLGYLIMDKKEHELAIRSYLQEPTFRQFVAVLDKFYNFMKMTACAVGSNKGNKATEKILNYFIAIDKPVKLELKEEPTDLRLSGFYDSVANSSSSLDNTLA